MACPRMKKQKPGKCVQIFVCDCMTLKMDLEEYTLSCQSAFQRKGRYCDRDGEWIGELSKKGGKTINLGLSFFIRETGIKIATLFLSLGLM